MKFLSSIIVLLFASVSFVLLTSELKSGSGSIGGKTGSPGDGVTCTQCHGGSANPQAGWISSNIPSGGYIPGQTYTITATGTHTGVGLFGFEVTAENSTANKTGTFVVTNSIETQLTGNGNSITHTSGGTQVSGNSRSWTFDWIAPAAGTGTVGFYGAFNAANGNGSNSGDVIYTSNLFATESLSASVSNIEAETLKVWPIPADNYLNISLKGRDRSIQLFNTAGQLIAEGRIVNSRASMDISHVRAGVYFLNIEELSGGSRRIVVR